MFLSSQFMTVVNIWMNFLVLIGFLVIVSKEIKKCRFYFLILFFKIFPNSISMPIRIYLWSDLLDNVSNRYFVPAYTQRKQKRHLIWGNISHKSITRDQQKLFFCSKNGNTNLSREIYCFRFYDKDNLRIVSHAFDVLDSYCVLRDEQKDLYHISQTMTSLNSTRMDHWNIMDSVFNAEIFWKDLFRDDQGGGLKKGIFKIPLRSEIIWKIEERNSIFSHFFQFLSQLSSRMLDRTKFRMESLPWVHRKAFEGSKAFLTLNLDSQNEKNLNFSTRVICLHPNKNCLKNCIGQSHIYFSVEIQ